MKKLLYFLVLYTAICMTEDSVVPLNQYGERRMVIVVASYNNFSFYRRNLDSILNQQYDNYQVIYIDDNSTDGTYDAVHAYLKRHRNGSKVILVRNEKRLGALHNQYDAIHQCKNTDIVIIVDGDDLLHDEQVLKYINSVYSNPNIWLTYGQWIDWETRKKGWCIAMPRDIVQRNAFREFTHAPSHLRTFYAGLFQQIKKEDLMYEGNFFCMSGDVATMFPMIEMARKNHFLFIDKPLLIYNGTNPLNNHKVIHGLEHKLDIEVRSRRRYEPITTPFLSASDSIASVAAA